MGSGSHISVYGEPWLPDKNPFVISVNPTLNNVKVSQLMLHAPTRWDEELLEDMFEERDRGLIRQIPLYQTHKENTLTWNCEITRVYSVKSTYKLIQEEAGR